MLQGVALRKSILFRIIEMLDSDDIKMREASVAATRHMSRIRPHDSEIQEAIIRVVDKENPYSEALEAAGYILVPTERSLQVLFRHIKRPEAISSLGLLLAVAMLASMQSNQVLLAQPPPNVTLPH